MHEKNLPNKESCELIYNFPHPAGRQVCSFYKQVEELKESIIPFIFKNLEHNRKVIFIAKEGVKASILAYCSSNNKINKCIHNGQLRLISISASDLENNGFFPQGIIELIIRECDDAKNLQSPELLIVHDINYALEHISNLDRLIGYEAILKQQLQNFKYTSISLFNSEILGFELLNSIIDIYPYCYINSEIYTNSFYIPPQCYVGENKQQNIFNFKLEKLAQAGHDKKNSHSTQYIEIRRHLYKVMHDLKAPIRTAHITNNMLVESGSLNTNENKDILLIMSKSLIQAYEQINNFEAMIKTFGSETSVSSVKDDLP